MKRKELVDLVHLTINRAKLSPDEPVSKPYINKMLPAAISEAILIYTREENREAYNDFRLYGGSDGGVVQPFLTTYEYTPAKDTSRDLYAITLSNGIQTVPGDQGLSAIYSKNGESVYRKVSGPHSLVGMDMVETTFFWYEKISDGSTKVFFKNMGLPVCSVMVRMVVSVEELPDDADLPIPDGYLMRVIDRVTEFFYKQKGIPVDNIANDKQDGQ